MGRRDPFTASTAEGLTFHLLTEGDVVRRYPNTFLGQHLTIDTGTTGSGKTEKFVRLVRQMLSEYTDSRILIVVPTHDLAHELVGRLQSSGIDNVGHWLGWDQADPVTGKYYCWFKDLATLARDAGGDPKRLCQSSKGRLCRYAADTRCELFKQRQKENVPAVQVATHHILPHKMENRSAFDLVVIDEDVIGTLVTDERYAPAELIGPDVLSITDLHENSRGRRMAEKNDDGNVQYYPGLTGDQLDSIRRQLLDACEAALAFDKADHRRGRILLAKLPPLPELLMLRDAIFTMLGKQRPKDVAPVGTGRTGSTLLKERLEADAKKNRPFLRARQMLDQLLTAITTAKPDEVYVPGALITEGKHATHLRLAVVMPIHEDYRAPDILLLSATAQPDLYTPFFGKVSPRRTEAPPRPSTARYHLIPDSGAKSKLLDLDTDPPEPKPHLIDVANVIIAKAREHRDEARGGFDGYIVAQQEVVAHLKTYVEEHAPEVLDRLGFEHFNAVAGTDRYKQVRFGFVIGRPLPQMSAVLPLAEALARHSLTPDAEDALYRFTVADKKGRDGQPRPSDWDILRATIEVAGTKVRTAEPVAQNEFLDNLIRATTHAQVLQADRTRANRRTEEEPVDLYVMCALDLRFAIDFNSVVQLKHMRSWYHQMVDFGIVPDLSKKRGINPLIAAVLHDQFKDERAVRDRRRKDKARHGIDESQWIGTEGWPRTQRAELLLPGERYNSRVLVRASTPDDARDVLERLIEDGRLPHETTIKVVRVRSERSDKGKKRRPGGQRPTRRA